MISTNYLEMNKNIACVSRKPFTTHDKKSMSKHGLYCYQIRHSDNNMSKPETIEENVTVNHYCDIVLTEPINFNNKDYVNLTSGDKDIIKELISKT